MRRLVITLIVVLVVASSLAWWADHPGYVTITWETWRIDTSFAVLVFFAALLLAAGLALQALYHWAKRDLPFVGENRHLRRQRRGLDALNRAIVALAAGDGRAARKLVKKAQRLLPPQPMMRVVAAQAAKLSGDAETARKEFEALMEDEQAAFLGVRGLLVEAIAEGRERDAKKLAGKARELEPESAWAIKTQFDLQVRDAEWADARATLKAAKKARAFDPATVSRLNATLLYCEAKEADLANDKATALKLAAKALRAKKGFLPAALMTARLNREAGKTAKAARTLETAWAVEPHPELAAAYAALAPMETPTARLRRFKKLTRRAKDHPESLLQLAEAAIEADHLSEARGYLERALGKTGRARAYALMRALDEKRGASASVIEKWTAKEQAGRPEPMWVCDSCGAEARRWSLHCPSCRMFNTLSWQREKEAARKSAGEASDFLVMMPDSLKGEKKARG